MAKWKTQKQYIGSSNKCPRCDSDNITADSVSVDDGIATQDVSCEDCKAIWTDIYKLLKYERREK